MKTLLTKIVPTVATPPSAPVITILTVLATGFEIYKNLKLKEDTITKPLDDLADKLTDIFSRF